MSGEKKMHIALSEGDVGRYVLLPGDPGRCQEIANYFDNPRFVASNREFTTYTGSLLGVKVCVTSTGIGGPSAAIAMEELASLGADTFIRVGTCGGIAPDVCSGDCVVATGAVRAEGTSREYAPIEFPAVANLDLALALRQACENLNFVCHAGVVQSKDSFYGQHDPHRMPVSWELEQKWEAWKRLGVLASEMESAALFTVAAALSVKCGAIFHVIWNKDREKLGYPQTADFDTDKAVRAAVEAIKLLIEKGG